MKTSLSSLDIAALVAEIRPKIVNSWINNIYSVGENRVILRFRKSTESPFELIFELGKRFHITKYNRKKPPSPNNKILSLRKHIRDLPVKDFYQVKLDRVVVFEIAYKDGFYKLVLELFGEGNLVLVGPNDKIILAYKYRRMRDRDIHPGRVFYYPPSSDDNILNLTEEKFFEKIAPYTGKISSFLSELLGLGPIYSKDVMSKSHISGNQVSELTEEEKTKMFETISTLQERIADQNYNYMKYLDEGEIVDITPIPVNRYSDLENIELESFNNDLDDFFSLNEEEPDYTEDKTEVTGKMSKLHKILSDQENHLESLREQELIEKRRGDLLYSKFSEVDELITTIIGARKNGQPWDEIEQKIQLGIDKGIPSAAIFDKIDPKTKSIWVKIFDEEEDKDEVIELDFTLSLADSANLLYERSKKARRKFPGAEAAIERTKKQIIEAESRKQEIEQEVEEKPLTIKRSKRWYEKFHWFLCGEHVIIGGTDAKTNERILKTYLDDNDLFFHADVHGAPYIVVKDGRSELSEECKNQIAIFALNYSSLWKDKKLVGDVYSVLPDQVSLTPPTGQYLAKGSVMIYGEKLYYKNVEIDHAIGVVFFDEYAQVIAGPSESIENRTELIISLKPGNIPKGTIAKSIREKFIAQCTDNDRYKIEALTVNDFLPFIPGDSDFVTKNE